MLTKINESTEFWIITCSCCLQLTTQNSLFFTCTIYIFKSLKRLFDFHHFDIVKLIFCIYIFFRYSDITTYIKGFSPVWTLLWTSKFVADVNHLLHSIHWNSLSPAWDFSCLRRLPLVENVRPQIVQAYGRWPEWCLEWAKIDKIKSVNFYATIISI